MRSLLLLVPVLVLLLVPGLGWTPSSTPFRELSKGAFLNAWRVPEYLWVRRSLLLRSRSGLYEASSSVAGVAEGVGGPEEGVPAAAARPRLGGLRQAAAVRAGRAREIERERVGLFTMMVPIESIKLTSSFLAAFLFRPLGDFESAWDEALLMDYYQPDEQYGPDYTSDSLFFNIAIKV
jgi:hypothetical protein